MDGSSKIGMPSPEPFDDEYDDKEDELAAKNAKVSTAMYIMTMIALGCLGTNAAVIVFMFVVTNEIAQVSLVAAAIGAFVGLLVAKRNVFDMTPTNTLRFIHNKLRRKVHHLYLENNKLHEHVNHLEAQVGELGDVENQLTAITKEQGTNVDQLVKLVKENGQITTKMTAMIKASAAMQLMDQALDSDRDESNKLSDEEIDGLLLRLGNVKGIIVNEEVLRTQLKEDSSINNVMAMLNYAGTYASKYPPGSNKKPQMGEDAPVFTVDPTQLAQ